MIFEGVYIMSDGLASCLVDDVGTWSVIMISLSVIWDYCAKFSWGSLSVPDVATLFSSYAASLWFMFVWKSFLRIVIWLSKSLLCFLSWSRILDESRYEPCLVSGKDPSLFSLRPGILSKAESFCSKWYGILKSCCPTISGLESCERYFCFSRDNLKTRFLLISSCFFRVCYAFS